MKPVIITAPDQIGPLVRAALRQQFGVALDSVDDDASLRDTLGDRFDSLAVLDCVSRVERTFGIEVDFVDHDVRYSFATVRRISSYVRDQLEDLAVLGRPSAAPR
ncbi:MAG: acyl carrier protein [Kibdelosporangium sp.]